MIYGRFLLRKKRPQGVSSQKKKQDFFFCLVSCRGGVCEASYFSLCEKYSRRVSPQKIQNEFWIFVRLLLRSNSTSSRSGMTLLIIK